MKKERVQAIFKVLEREMKEYSPPMSEQVHKKYGDPFKTLVATLISARSRDALTLKMEGQLFKELGDPKDFAETSTKKVERLLYPISFYRNKAANLISLSKKLLKDFKGKVPDNLEDLLTLPGVGRKTANIVLNVAFGQPTVGVDIHVWRVSNRLDIVRTPSPDKTEDVLKKAVPKKEWGNINRYLVTHGQNICTPGKPSCTKCPLFDLCPRRGVKSYK